MGIFLDKIVKPLFRSQKGNWVSRINELTDNQLKIAYSGQTKEEKDGDRLAFVNALDGLVAYIDNYDAILESVAKFILNLKLNLQNHFTKALKIQKNYLKKYYFLIILYSSKYK